MLLRGDTPTLLPYTTLFRSLSKDGELVVIHDEELDRTTNGTGLVRDHTLTQLQSFCADNHMPGFADATALQLGQGVRSEEHTSELQSRFDLVCRLLLLKKEQ